MYIYIYIFLTREYLQAGSKQVWKLPHDNPQKGGRYEIATQRAGQGKASRAPNLAAHTAANICHWLDPTQQRRAVGAIDDEEYTPLCGGCNPCIAGCNCSL